jgi:hypothetical protein
VDDQKTGVRFPEENRQFISPALSRLGDKSPEREPHPSKQTIAEAKKNSSSLTSSTAAH